ncbi:MAG: 16S rRNA (cytidine(1402)-2'-O)-methyltransferase [Candidatus Vogelbacteria bacterium]|nr:16S rRNA (cytidine(1402)-2'-O)-methyltransferase [Candidatus Vogelbacteria bacterium]
MSNLYIVATPIGNLEDITFRAIETLKSADIILCEDTRVTKKLLDRYSIVKPTISYHSQSKLKKIDEIIELLREGKNLALVSDAGTPAISDPGSFLVSRVRRELFDSVRIIPIPGPSAVVSALSASGFPASDFLFLGFLPHKKGRQALFEEIKNSKRTVVFYESPHRFLKSLESLGSVLESKRLIAIGRELTKIYEETRVGTTEELLSFYSSNPDKVRGEFVVIVRAL